MDRTEQKQPLVLLFGFPVEQTLRICGILSALGIEGRSVPAAQYGASLAELVDNTAKSGPGPRLAPMLVMHALKEGQMDALLLRLRQAGIPVPLKAVTTPSNLRWSPVRLQTALRQEQEQLRKMLGR